MPRCQEVAKGSSFKPLRSAQAGSGAVRPNQVGKAAGPTNGPGATGSGSFFRFVPVRLSNENVMLFISGSLANRHFSAFQAIFRFVFALFGGVSLILSNFSGSFYKKITSLFFSRRP
jgi:hypothetical protein